MRRLSIVEMVRVDDCGRAHDLPLFQLLARPLPAKVLDCAILVLSNWADALKGFRMSVALFLSDPASGASPAAVFDHWQDNSDGTCYAATGDGHYVSQLGNRGGFHFDATNPGQWETMKKSGQGVVTQNGSARFTYYWLNWL